MPYKDKTKALAASRKSYRKHKTKKLAACKTYYQDNKLKVRARANRYRRALYQKTPEWQLYYGAKKRAKQKSMVFDLDKSDIVIPEFCPVLGLRLCVNKGKVQDNSPTIDRIDNNRGYTKDNIIVVCWKANRIKGNASVAELKIVYEFYRDLNLCS